MQCNAKSSRTGKQCTRRAIQGGTVCIMHGGSAPRVRNAADARLALEKLLDPAINELRKLLHGKKTADAVKRQAIDSVLDRNGLKPIDHHALTLNPNDLTDAQLLDLLDRLEGQSRRLRVLGAGAENPPPPGTDSIQ